MYFYELFSHSDRFSYRAHLISNATCVFILCTTLTFLPPFLLTYYTGDFWEQELIYSEQPRLDNRIKFLLIAENYGGNDNQFFQSSYATLQQNFLANVIPGETKASTFDIDGDGIIDQFRTSFDIKFDQTTSRSIISINIWLIFQFQLRDKQLIDMETMAMINFIPPGQLTSFDNKNITVYGQLLFEQNKLIPNAGNDSTYNVSIIDENTLSLSSSPDLDSILEEYFQRKYYTSYQTEYTWITPRVSSTSDKLLTVNVVVNIGRQAIRYMPGFWQGFKWGWIQYICVFLPFMIVFNRLKLFVFSNHLVRTFVPLEDHRHKA